MTKTKKPNAYAQAGVDIDLGNRVKARLPELLASTHRPGVIGKVGGFGGLFALDTEKYRKPILVSSVDGVGTKLKLAFALNRHETVGQDLVNHCVNDIAVLGAEPLFFLDYISTGKLEKVVFEEIIAGFAKACAESHCALIGGETAQMPGFYQPGEYDLNGTIVGVVEKSKMLDGQKTVKQGDAIIGLASNGLHTNGYSLARKIFFDTAKLKITDRVEEFGVSVGEELMKIHTSYSRLVQALIKRFNAKESHIHAFAHITGGGFIDNIPRVLPKNCDALIRKGTWTVLPVFRFIETNGQVPELEMYQVFNMGVGMVTVVSAEQADSVLKFVRRKHKAWIIGEITRGTKKVQIVS
ncbi:MAG: phosphoribosylformylglycinamidine cyclo-ligase [bacterium]|nr:phosphoribosylformylglycinamidine cyclo-ligase [bacterium]